MNTIIIHNCRLFYIISGYILVMYLIHIQKMLFLFRIIYLVIINSRETLKYIEPSYLTELDIFLIFPSD